MQILTISRLTVARLNEQAANLSPEEAHSANDLALYTVNTQSLYQAFKRSLAHCAQKTARGLPVHFGVFRRHADDGRVAYRAEMKADPLHDVRPWREDAVLNAAAAQILDHYSEEIDGLAGR